METCKMCGRTLQGAWVDMRVGGLFHRLCESCAKKDVPMKHAEAAGRYL